MFRAAVCLLAVLPAVLAQRTPAPPEGVRPGPGGGGPRRGGMANAQQPAQPAGPPGAVRGRVVALTGEPLRKAEVSLRSFSGGGAMAVTTDAAGVFSFDNVAPGNYGLSVQRNGYVRHELNARPGERAASTPLAVAPGAEVTGLTIKLTPHAVVTGKVVDEDGDAVARQMVQVMRERWSRGQRQLLPMGSDTTNDLGEYRVAGVAPGRYYVMVNAGRGFEGPPVNTARPRPVVKSEPEMGYTATFYPNVFDPAQAGAIDLAAGQEARGIDFQIRKVVTHRVRGRVVDASGGPLANATIMVMPGDASFGMSARTMAMVRNPEGAFEVAGLAPGNYTVIVNRMGREEGRATSLQTIQVGNRDLENVVLSIAPPLDVSGTVRVEGNAAADLSRTRVLLESATAFPMFGGGAQPVAAGGAFTVAGIAAGKYRVSVIGAPEGTYVKSIRLGGQEVPGLDVTIGAGSALEIVLGVNAPAIAGTVVDSNGKPVPNAFVAVVPEGARRNQYHLYGTAVADDAGAFSVKSVAPGEYRAMAFVESQAENIQNPSFVAQWENRAALLKVTEGKAETLQLAPLQ